MKTTRRRMTFPGLLLFPGLLILLALATVLSITPTVSADEQKSITPADHPALLNPVMHWATRTDSGKEFSKDPSVVKFGDKYLMYFSIPPHENEKTPYAWHIGIAQCTSAELDKWTLIGEVTPLCQGDQRGLAAPCAKVWDGKVHLFYQSYGNGSKDAIYYAVSNDGVKFESVGGQAVFSPSGNWTNGRAIDADFFEFDGKCFLFAATRDPSGRIQKQVVATADNRNRLGPGNWTQACSNSILEPEFDWETKCIEAATVCLHDGKMFMFYAGGYNNDPQQIGLAVSTDGLTWKRVWNVPFIPNGKPGMWNYSESGHPGVFFDESTGRWWLFLQGNKDHGKSWYLSRVELVWKDGLPEVK